MIGTTLGRYRITAKLGEGGMGSVWRAEDTLLGRPVAIKLLKPELASDQDARLRLLREARAASCLEHSGIATIHDAGDSGGQMWVAYQLIEGAPLSHALREGPLSLPQLLRLARGTSEALAHAHGRGVLHRDLTAGNIMLRADDSPVVVDFGLARTLTDATLTATGATVGTAAYMSPEQWTGASCDARSDLWSLGVVLYRAATGRAPFAGESAQAVMYQVLNAEPESPVRLRPELPPQLSRAILRLLEKDPRDRIPTAEALAAELRQIGSAEEAADGSARAGARESPMESAMRWWRRQTRRRLGAAQVVGLIVVAMAVAVAAMMLRPRAGRWSEHVLAVLPLRNTSQDGEESDYIGEGLGSELTARLGRMGGFRVLPWETCSRYGDTKLGFVQLAQQLGADMLLVGSYHGDGEKLSVQLELVDGHGGFQRWAEQFSRDQRELASVQAEIADSIAVQLLPGSGGLSSQVQRVHVSANPEAYELYLRGVVALRAVSLADRALAEPLFRRVLELDSTLSQAWVGLGAVLLNGYYEGSRGGLEELRQAGRYFERALALDPRSGPALRGLVRVYNEGDDTVERGLAIADSAGPRVQDEVERELLRGATAFGGGLIPESVAPLQRTLALDAHNQAARLSLSWSMWWGGRWAEAVENDKAYIREFGEDPDIYTYLGGVLGTLGRLDEAALMLQRAVVLFQGSGGTQACMYLAAVLRARGEVDAAKAMLSNQTPLYEAQLASHPDNLRLRLDLGTLYAAAGDMKRFDASWAESMRWLSHHAGSSGAAYVVTPFALAQAGELDRARSVLRQAIRSTDGSGWTLTLPAAGLESLFRGGATDSLTRSPEFVAARLAAAQVAARRRELYPWVSGAGQARP